MHDIDAVIENIADGARGQRDAGKLAVDRVEARHRISGYKSPTEHTLPEQRKGDEDKYETRKRYLIGRDAKLGAALDHIARGQRPDILDHEIERASRRAREGHSV